MHIPDLSPYQSFNLNAAYVALFVHLRYVNKQIKNSK